MINSTITIISKSAVPLKGESGKKVLLRIKHGLIESIKTLNNESSREANFDYGEFLLAPMLVDYHIHLKWPIGEAKLVRALLSSGITKCYEGGSGRVLEKPFIESDGLRVEAMRAGHGIFRKGGYGEFIGKGVSSLSEAEEVMDFLKQKGIEYLKVINSGVFDPETGGFTEGGFKRDELKAIISIAKKKGWQVFCHANGDSAIKDAVIAGADVIVHGFGVSRETMKIMRDGETALIPTLHALSALRSTNLSLDGLRNLDQLLAIHSEAVATAHEVGVRILPGSDSGPSFLPPGISFLRELEAIHNAGISYAETIGLAAGGRLREGEKASFLIIDGFSVSTVCIEGKWLEFPARKRTG